jgi:hypothetical protein
VPRLCGDLQSAIVLILALMQSDEDELILPEAMTDNTSMLILVLCCETLGVYLGWSLKHSSASVCGGVGSQDIDPFSHRGWQSADFQTMTTKVDPSRPPLR